MGAVPALADGQIQDAYAKLSQIKEKFQSQRDGYDALIGAVTSAQEAGQAPSTYQESYENLLKAKEELASLDSELSAVISELQKYLSEHPDLPPGELKQLEDALDSADSFAVVITSYLLKISEIEAKQAEILGKMPEERPRVKPELDVRGEASILTGNGTFTDRDRQFLSLTEIYKNEKEQVFTFMERYENNHSFIDSRRWTFGMSQEFPIFLGGELSLQETLDDFKDVGNPANDRRQLNLDLDFQRAFNRERTFANFSYGYISKNFKSVSTRSYIHNRASLELTHEFSSKVIGNAFWRMLDYHYALGDFLGYNATYLGGGLQILPCESTMWDFAYQSLEKSYDVQKASAYFEEFFKIGGRWQPDIDTLLEGDVRFLDHNRRRTPTQSYNEKRLRLRYSRAFSEEASGDLSFEWRDKDFDIPSPNDYRYLRWQAYLNLYPSANFRWYYNFDFYDYDYTSALRSYNRMYNRLGANFRFENGVTLTTEFALTDQNYSAETGRNYTIRDFLTDLSIPVGRRDSIRFFLLLSRLNQSQPLSVNDYSATDFGIEYNRRLSEHYRLKLIYTYDRRDYERQADIKDTAIEARLSFNF